MLAVYLANNQFRVTGNHTDVFLEGRRVKADCGSDGIKYVTVLTSAYFDPNTSVTIKETSLTSNLTTVLYGIIEPGSMGSLPDHDHGGPGDGGTINEITTASGVLQGQIDDLDIKIDTTSGTLQSEIDSHTHPATPTTLSGLTDTPSDYGISGQYLQSTGAGTQWATVSGGGGGSSDVQTFLDLTDTPSSYVGESGKYVMATTSGLEFSNPPSTISSDYYARELMYEWNLNNETMNTTINGLQGDADDILILEYQISSATTSPSIYAYFNGDETSSNYNRSLDGENNGAPDSDYSATSNGIFLGYTDSTRDAVGTGIFYLKSGGNRQVHVLYGTGSFTGPVWHQYNAHGTWANANDEVTSIRFYTTTTISGSMKLYKMAQVQLPIPTASKGVQTISYDYITASGININPGTIYLNDGVSERLCSISQQFTKNFTGLSTDTWYYLYVNPAGVEITSDNIEYSTTEPYKDIDRSGYYHTTSSGWRCIGTIYSDDSSNVTPFGIVGNKYKFLDSNIRDITASTADTWTTVTFTIPFGETYVEARVVGIYGNAGSSVPYRTKGYSGDGFTLVSVGSAGIYDTSISDLYVDINKQGEYKWTATSTNAVYFDTLGYVTPDLIYTGAAAQLATTQDDTLVSLYEGKQSIQVEYKDADEIYLNPGKIEINGVLYKITSQLTKQLTGLSTSTWYYIYAKPPTSGKVLTLNEIEYNSTSPTENKSRFGWFHGTNTNWRCIGAIYSDSSSNLEEFTVENDCIVWVTARYTNISSTDIGTSASPNTVNWSMVPAFGRRVYATFNTSSYNANSAMYYSIYSGVGGSEGTNFHTDGRTKRDMRIVACTASQQGYVWETSSTTNTYTVMQYGYFLPDSIYNR